MICAIALAILALLIIGWKIVVAAFACFLLIVVFVFALEGGQACLTAATKHYAARMLARRNKKAVESIKTK